MIEIAKKLRRSRESLCLAEITLNNLLKIKKYLEFAVTPPEGWAGKNADEREISRQRRLYEHDGYQKVCFRIDRYSNFIEKVKVRIQCLVDDRRAAEWEIVLKTQFSKDMLPEPEKSVDEFTNKILRELGY